MKATILSDEGRPGPKSPYRKLPIIGPMLDSFLTWVRCRGYAESTIRNHLKAAGLLWRWLQQRCDPALPRLGQSDFRSAFQHFRMRRSDVAAAARLAGRFFAEQQLLRMERPEPPSRAEQQIRRYLTLDLEVKRQALDKTKPMKPRGRPAAWRSDQNPIEWLESL